MKIKYIITISVTMYISLTSLAHAQLNEWQTEGDALRKRGQELGITVDSEAKRVRSAAKADFVLSPAIISRMTRACEDNEIRALKENKNLQEIVEVKGKVSSFDDNRAFGGDAGFDMAVKGQSGSIRCSFDDTEEGRVANLHKGQHIVVWAVFSNGASCGDFWLKGCVIKKPRRK